jgi:hypothetical protein
MSERTSRTIVGTLFILLALAMIAGIISCTPQKRLARLVKKHPNLIKTDTVYYNDTLISVHSSKDTIVSIHHHVGDTVYIHSQKLTERIIYLKGDSILVQGDCAPDTVIHKVKETINTISQQEGKTDYTGWIVAGIVSLILFFLIFCIVKFR